MTRVTLLAAAALTAASLAPAAADAAEQLDGKKIFLAQKCETCHAAERKAS